MGQLCAQDSGTVKGSDLALCGLVPGGGSALAAWQAGDMLRTHRTSTT
jgi:hypothetical protein